MHLKGKRLWIGLLSAIIVVAILATLIARIPPASLQILPETPPLFVVVSNPMDGSTWAADTPIPVEVMVTAGASIKSLEFWTDGRLFDTHVPDANRQRVYKVWSWLPLTEGTHAVFVRATDVNGRAADSNAVHIQATAAAGMLTVQTAKGGETFQSLAEQNGVTIEQIAAANPSIDPAGVIATGTDLFIPGNPFSLPSTTGSSASPVPAVPAVPVEAGVPSGLSFYIERTLNLNKTAPAAASLSASVEACKVTLFIQDNSENEDGFYVYALSETSKSFQRILSLKAHAGKGLLEHTLQDQRGSIQFYVGAYNAAGETHGAPAVVNVTDPQCNPESAQNNPPGLKLQNGFLTIPNQVQLAYFYASVNGKAWQRIPSGHDFLQPNSGSLDLRTEIQQLSGGNASDAIDMDVWGWSAGTLVHLGPLHSSLNVVSLLICDISIGCMGDMAQLYWKTESLVDPDQANPSRKLEWKATGTGITHGIWQVSTQPFPAEYSVGAPPGLLISGISQATYSETTGLYYGDFTIDFKTDLQYANNENLPVPTPTASRYLRQPTGLELFNLGSIIKPSFPVTLPEKLYIRVTPIAGVHPASDPSNSVLVTLQPSAEQPPIHFYQVPTYAVEIVPDSYVSEVKTVQEMGIMGCSEITAVDHDVFVAWYMQALGSLATVEMAEQAYHFYADHIGQVACPGIVELPDDTVLDEFGQALEGMWNGLASALEQAKSGLVEAVASLIPGCGETCKTLLMTGLNFTITYFTGLPPSIPDFDTAVSMGIDYAVQLAISQSGIPYCDETCQGQISDEIQGIASEVASSGKPQPGCASGGSLLWLYVGTQLYHLKPLCFPPGVSFQPVKGSMYENAMVQVKVTRIDGSPQAVGMQQLVLNTKSLNAAYADGHSEKTYYRTETQANCQYVQGHQSCVPLVTNNYYDMVYSLPLVGMPYPQIAVTVPALKAGQSMLIPVVFQSNYAHDYKYPDVYPPRAIAIQKANPQADLATIPVNWGWDFTQLTASGALITIDARVLCEDKSTPLIYNSPCSEINSLEFVTP